jgi:hypothetical protein
LQNTDLAKDGIHYEQNYVGLCGVKRNFVNELSGFDEYFMVWGGEDDDLYRRLKWTGVERKQIAASDFQVFHQWHQTESPVSPSLWYLTMANYLFRKSEIKTSDADYSVMVDESNRQIFEKMNSKDFDIKLRLSKYDSSFLIFNDIISDFYSDRFKSGYFIYNEPESQIRSHKTFKFFRSKSKKEETVSHLKQGLIDFFQYFIGINRRNLLDYYFQAANGCISFYYIKN